LLVGTSPGLAADGSGKPQVFGVAAEGGSFLYVFDRSLSMQGAPLAAAKRELIASLGQLKRVQQFQILFYNQNAKLMQPQRMMFADENGKRQAESYIAGIQASGATDHVQALMLALRSGPEVIFFLTDADEPQLTAKELETIRQKNGGTIIHVIEFKSGPAKGTGETLRRLAEQNRGEYKYVDVTALPAK
jgi:hypothetical protein